MKDAFGVQQDIVTYDIPKGTSIIALNSRRANQSPRLRRSSSRIRWTLIDPP